MKYGAVIPLMNEFRFLPAVVGQLSKVCDEILIVRSRLTQRGEIASLLPMPPSRGVEILVGDWPQEHLTRNAGIEELGRRGCEYIFTVDSDEIFTDSALASLLTACRRGGFQALSCGFYTYWKTANFRIDPPEQLFAPVVVHRDARFENMRMIRGPQQMIRQYLMHHLSYVRTDEEVLHKIRHATHAADIVPGWYERIWKGWDDNHMLEDLHPTHPPAYKRTIGFTSPPLNEVLAEHGVS